MKTTSFSRYAEKINPGMVILMLPVLGVMAFFIANDISNMKEAKTGYDY